MIYWKAFSFHFFNNIFRKSALLFAGWDGADGGGMEGFPWRLTAVGTRVTCDFRTLDAEPKEVGSLSNLSATCLSARGGGWLNATDSFLSMNSAPSDFCTAILADISSSNSTYAKPSKNTLKTYIWKYRVQCTIPLEIPDLCVGILTSFTTPCCEKYSVKASFVASGWTPNIKIHFRF